MNSGHAHFCTGASSGQAVTDGVEVLSHSARRLDHSYQRHFGQQTDYERSFAAVYKSGWHHIRVQTTVTIDGADKTAAWSKVGVIYDMKTQRYTAYRSRTYVGFNEFRIFSQVF
jgi:hypothetical protein